MLPCGGQTLSKSPSRFPMGAHPILLDRGEGSRVWDVDGNEYIDYVCGLGPVILGYNHPVVNDAIRRQLETGLITASLETPLVGEVAEILCDMVPCAEAVRFVKTGSDACSAAIRLARAYTGRDVILTNGYHGWDETFQCAADDERGRAGTLDVLTDTTVPIDYNDIDGLEELFAGWGHLVAAVIIEPARTFEPDPRYLLALKLLCRKYGALLIFDEVVTSFRWSRGGAQEYYGVTPDIACLGKAMANGMPLGAVVGRRDVMEAFERCFVSGTYGGEALSLAAAKATLQIIRDEPVIEHIRWQGARLQTAFDGAARRHGLPAKSVGVPVCSVQTFEAAPNADANFVKSLWLQETAKRGLLLGNIQYVNYSHGDRDIATTDYAMGAAAATVAGYLATASPADWLEGAPIGVDTYQLGVR